MSRFIILSDSSTFTSEKDIYSTSHRHDKALEQNDENGQIRRHDMNDKIEKVETGINTNTVQNKDKQGRRVL